MKKILFYFIGCFIVGCHGSENTRTCNLDDYPVDSVSLQVHEIDTGLVLPTGIYVFQDKLLVIEPKKQQDMVSVFSRDSFRLVCSGIAKGHARNEVLSLRDDFLASTDTSFFVLNRNEVKEYTFQDEKLAYIGSSVVSIPDALNEVLKVGPDRYITAGFTNGTGNIHLLYSDGEYEGFGEYPGPDLKDGGNFFLMVLCLQGWRART